MTPEELHSRLSDEAKTYVALWIQLDNMWNEGKGESKEADDLRENMSSPWYELTDKDCDDIDGYLTALGRYP